MTTHEGAARPDPTVVLVPGLGLDARAWARVRARLPGRASVVTLPSLGRRSARGTDLRVEAQAERLLEALVATGADQAVLVGHSASCAVVVEAARRSTLVVGLVLIGPVTDPRARTWPRMLGQWLRTATHERVREACVLVPQYRQTGARSMQRGMDAVRWYRTDLEIARLDLPVVVMRGTQDRIAAQDWCQRLADLSRGRLITVDRAAHMVPLTDPDAVATAVHDVRSAIATLLATSGPLTALGVI